MTGSINFCGGCNPKIDSDNFAVIIAGPTVNAHAVCEDCLATIALQKIEEFIAKKETPVVG